MRPPIAAVVLGLLGVALVGSGCPEDDDRNYPVLSGTGAGSLPGGVPDDAGAAPLPEDTDTGADGGTGSDTGRGTTGTGTGATGGSGTLGDDATFGAETIGATSLGEPPPVTTGVFTTTD